MKVKIELYDALPCAMKVFEINGISADKDDFGMGFDHNRKRAEPYGCGCHKFDAYREYTKEIHDKYNITESEYLEVCDLLEDKLYVGYCGWCV